MANALILEPRAPVGVVASSTAPGRRAANVANDYMGMVWRSGEGADSQAITLDLGADVPLDTMIPSLDDKTTELDVIVQVDFKDDMDADYRDSWCDQVRGQSDAADAALDGHGQCGAGTLAYERGSGGLGASVPYFDLRLDVSCDLSTDCVPQLPASFTDEAGFAAMRAPE